MFKVLFHSGISINDFFLHDLLAYKQDLKKNIIKILK